MIIIIIISWADTFNGSQLTRTGKFMKAGSPASAREFHMSACRTRAPPDVFVEKGKS
jgi:hypothetical protein